MKKKCIFSFVLLLLLAGVLNAWEIRKETAVTDDGITLVAKRYMNKNGIPVILLHGFASNYYTWDIPGKSLGKFLADHGYDVWLFNLRGHGEGEFQSGPSRGPGNWDFDTFAVYDVPAMIRKVMETTGKRPFWIGHSMGGMLIYAYLEGVYPVKENYGFTVSSSEELSIKRNRNLRGVVAVGSPAGLSYPVNLENGGLESLTKYNYSDYNLLLETMVTIPWNTLKKFLYPVTHNESLTDSLNLPPEIILSNSTFTLVMSIMSPIFSSFLGMKRLPDLGYIHKYIEKNLHMTPFQFVLGNIWNVKNTELKDIYFMYQHGLDNISPQLIHQFYNWLRYGNFKELCDGSPCNNYDYEKHLKRITLPILFIAGELDKLANKDNIKVRVFKKIGSGDRKFVVFKGFGHVDLCMGKRVERVFNLILRWLRLHE